MKKNLVSKKLFCLLTVIVLLMSSLGVASANNDSNNGVTRSINNGIGSGIGNGNGNGVDNGLINNQDTEIAINLENLEDSGYLNKPFVIQETYKNVNGEDIEVILAYEPEFNPMERLGFTKNASAGAWTVWASLGIASHSYKFDLTKNGSGWRISNARAHKYSGLITTSFSNPKLKISRANSTANFAAEINGSVVSKSKIGPIPAGTWTWWIDTTVTHSGTMKMRHN